MTNITDYYTKVKSVNELDLRQALAALAFYVNNIAPICPQITFTEFVRNNVFKGDDIASCGIGYYKAPDNKQNFIQKWRKEPNCIIHTPHIFWYLSEEEENEIKALF